MNRIYNLVWSITKERWIVVSEKVKGNGKVPTSLLKSIAVIAAMLASGAPAHALDPGALPAGGQVVSGSAAISTSGASMTVSQSTHNMIANWHGFDIGSAASVRFIQPNSSSTALNRVVGNNPSQIFGSLNANGRVFLVNPSGILFAPGSSVNVGAMVASTLDIRDSDFLAGKYAFFNSGKAGSVANHGSISGGFVALLGNPVENSGTIVTTKGTTGLGAGEEITLGFDPNGLMALRVDKGAYRAQVEQRGVIEADGGTVVMSAGAADALLATVVNNSGTVRANSMVERNGEIVFEGGTVVNSGTVAAQSVDTRGGRITMEADHITLASGSRLDASGEAGGGEVLVGGGWQGSGPMHQATTVTMDAGAKIDVSATQNGNGGTAVLWSDVRNPDSATRVEGEILAQGGVEGGDGGKVETSGHRLNIGDRASVSTYAGNGTSGEWLLDPYDFTIAASGGDITGAALGTALGQSNVSITTSNGSVSTTGLTNPGTGTSSGNGDIIFNDAVSWSANTLTLSAYRHIAVDSVLSVSGNANMSLATNTGGATGSAAGYIKMKQNGNGGFDGKINWSSTTNSVLIDNQNWQVLKPTDNINSIGKSNNYVLGADLDAAYFTASAFQPLFSSDTQVFYTGKFDGFGHTLSGLPITDTSKNERGFFSKINGATIQNLGIVDSTIKGLGTVGAFVGNVSGGTNILRNVFTAPASAGSARVKIESDASVGGLVGAIGSNATLSIYDSVNGAYVNRPNDSTSSGQSFGGLVGSSSGILEIANSSNSGQVIAGTLSYDGYLSHPAGGILGYQSGGKLTLNNVTNSGNVVGTLAGGVIGWVENPSTLNVSNLGNTGEVRNTNLYVGGVIGRLSTSAQNLTVTLSQLYNRGAVISNSGTAGGLVGLIYSSLTTAASPITIQNSFNDGTITGPKAQHNAAAGIVGIFSGGEYVPLAFDHVYNAGNVTTNENATPLYMGGLAGNVTAPRITLVQAYNRGTISSGRSDSTVGSLIGNYAVPSNPLTVDYAYALENSVVKTGTPSSSLWGFTPTNINGSTYAARTATDMQTVALMNSDTAWTQNNALNQGYIYLSGLVPRVAVNIAVNTTFSMTYGDTAPTGAIEASITGASGITLNWGSYLSTTTAAGSYGYGTANLLTLSGDTSAYSLTYTGSFTVNPKAVTLTGTKTYNGNTSTSGTNFTVGGTVNSDTVTVSSGSGTLASKDVGTHAINAMGTLALSSSNYTLTGATGSVTIYPKLLSIAAAKTYDGTATLTTATVTTGVGSETLNYSGVTANSKDFGAGNYINAIALSDGTNGGKISNYTLPLITAASANNSVTINKAMLTATASKTYDGSASLLGFLTLGGFVGTETVGFSAATASSSHVAPANKYVSSITLTDGTYNGLATNYQIPATYGDGTNAVTITAVTLTPTLTNASVTKVYDGGTSWTDTPTYSFTGFITNDTNATLSSTGCNFNDKDVADATTVTASGLAITGITGNNSSEISDYVLDATSKSASGARITRKAVSINSLNITDKVYDGTVNASSVKSTVLSGVVEGDTQNVNTSGTLANFGAKDVGTYSISVTGLALTGSEAGNYNLTAGTTATDDSVAITAKPLTLTASKTYDGTTGLTGFVTLGGFVGTETLGITSATGNDSHVATANKYVSAITLANGTNGGVTGNYSLPAYSYSAGVNSLTINTKTLTPTITNAYVTKVYDGALTSSVTPTYSFSGFVSGDTDATLNNTGKNYNTKDVLTANTITVSGLSIAGISGSNSSATSDYVLDATSKTVGGTITPKTLSVSGLAANNKTYNALTDVVITNWGSVTTGVGSESLTLNHDYTASFSDKNVANSKTVTAINYCLANGTGGELASNYQLSSTGATTSADITAKTITLAGSTGVTKTYDGRTSMAVGTNGYESLAGVESGDVVNVTGAPVYNSANVTSNSTVLIGSVGIGGTDAGNYSLSWSNGNGSITPAPLTVSANADARFVTTNDATGYNGVSYSGFVNGETTAVLSLGSLAYTRTNAGANAAGTYAGVIQPSGITANNGNYTISYVNGDYTIVPANQLLVRVANTGTTYGTGPAYTVSGASYLASDNSAIVNLTNVTQSGADNSLVQISDGAGGTASFTLGPVSPQWSTAARLEAGNYGIGASNIAESSSNFSNTLTVVGGLTVAQKALTANASNVSKVYDSTTAMTNVVLGYNGLETGDVVTISGNGNFTNGNVGSGKSYAVTSLTLGAQDAANYYLTGGNSFSGSNGEVTRKMLSLSANRVYDGTDSLDASSLVISTGVGNETLNFSGATANSKDVVAGNFVNAITLQDGSNGGVVGNYQLPGLTSANANNGVTFTRRPVLVTADPFVKKFIEPDPLFTWQSEAQSDGRGLLAGESLSGALSRDDGKSGGEYAIRQGTVDGVRNPNYNISFTGSTLIVKASTIFSNDVVPSVKTGTPQMPPSPTGPTGVVPSTAALVTIAVGPGGTGSPTGTTPPAGTSAGGGSGSALPKETVASNAGAQEGSRTDAAGRSDSIAGTDGGNRTGSDTGADAGSRSGSIAGTDSAPDSGSGSARSTAGRSGPPAGSGTDAGFAGAAEGGPGRGGFIGTNPAVTEKPADSFFVYELPASTFRHSDPSAVVSVEVLSVNGAPVPAWMSFDPVKKVIAGAPPKEARGEYRLELVARDQQGRVARSVLVVKVS